jgi:hypothetical protein
LISAYGQRDLALLLFIVHRLWLIVVTYSSCTHSVATPFVLSVLFDADILAADAAVTEAVKLFVPFLF